MVHELEAVDIGHAVAEAVGEVDNFGEAGVGVRVVDAGVFEILDHELVRFHNHAAADGVAGEAVGEMFELVIEGAVDLGNGVIEEGKGRFWEDDGGDAFGVALGVVAEFGDLLVGINFGEFIIVKFGVAAFGIGVDADGGEKFVEIVEGTEGNSAVLGDGIVVGVDFDGVAPMDAVGDSHREEENGMTGEFGEAGGGVEEEKIMVVELLELHDLRFDEALAVAESLASGAKVGFGRGVRAVFEFFYNFFELMEIKVVVFLHIFWFDGGRF